MFQKLHAFNEETKERNKNGRKNVIVDMKDEHMFYGKRKRNKC